MMDHTPGPWEIERGDSDDTLLSIRARDQFLVCRLCWRGGPYENADNNARLIAAAPETAAERDRLRAVNAELLDVARRAFAGCTCHSTMRPDIPCLSCAARDAIAHAKEVTA